MKTRKILSVMATALCTTAMFGATQADDGMIPFLAITGRPTEAEVRAKVAAIQVQGIESFLIYARSGLELEYMGEDLCSRM